MLEATTRVVDSASPLVVSLAAAACRSRLAVSVSRLKSLRAEDLGLLAQAVSSALARNRLANFQRTVWRGGMFISGGEGPT
jgi:hypothetical protein